MSASQNNKLTDNVAWWCSIYCRFCFCFSLDPCLSNPCVNGVCLRSSSSNSYVCQCNTGYTGLTCDTSTTTGTNINRSLLSTIHEVCHSCTNLVHGIVLQQQWICLFVMVCSTNRLTSLRSQKEAVQSGRLTPRVIELYFMRAS